MKWNWGTGIALTFIIFCALIIAAVARSFQENVDLVTEEYYKEELVYQKHIDREKNAQEAKNLIEVNTSGKSLSINFLGEGHLSGEVHFYRPDNPGLDQTFAIDKREMIFDKAKLIAGKYKVKISWTDSGKDFYREETIFI